MANPVVFPVGYVATPELCRLFDRLPSNEARSSHVDSLIRAYGLTEHSGTGQPLIPVSAPPLTPRELLRFHDPRLIRLICRKSHGKRAEVSDVQSEESSNCGETSDISDISDISDFSESSSDTESGTETESPASEILEQFGLLDDCPLFPELPQYARSVAGATIAACRFIAEQHRRGFAAPAAINWDGGRHHARRTRSAGFCYVNDAVLGILELRKHFGKVLYIDLDLHHGDGVESAFEYSRHVLCCSIHRFDLGFYPGTGKLSDCGAGAGRGYTVNVPLRAGLSDAGLDRIVADIVVPYAEWFQPEAVVVQCGADGLAADPHRAWNLTRRGYGAALQRIIGLRKPLVVLGGGGYHNTETAKCWTFLTGQLVGREGVFDHYGDGFVPQNEYLDEYLQAGPGFWDSGEARNVKDENDDVYIKEVASELLGRIGISGGSRVADRGGRI